MKRWWLASWMPAEQWRALTAYQRFETVIAAVLTLTISLVIVMGLYRLIAEVVAGLVLGGLNPLNQKVFQGIFGEIMTVLIALEFNHTLQYVVNLQQSVIQTKIVLLIALLALARKFILLDLKETTSPELLGLALVTLAIGASYWLVREREDRSPKT
jgi:uncharacterized membrane protein (DUF373 family)